MNHNVHLAGLHPSYGYHHAASGYGHGSAWITHMVVSSVIHGLIYSVIFRVLRHLTLPEMILLAVVVIWAIYAWNRNRRLHYW